MNLTRDAIITKSPNFMNLGLSFVHTSYELGSVSIPTTIIGRPTDGSNWLLPGHRIGKVTADRVSRTRPEQNYNPKSDFETRRGGVVNQDFAHQKILWVDQLWNWLLLVQTWTPELLLVWTWTTEQRHHLTWFQSEQNRQSLRYLHYQRIIQNKMEKCTYQGNTDPDPSLSD